MFALNYLFLDKYHQALVGYWMVFLQLSTKLRYKKQQFNVLFYSMSMKYPRFGHIFSNLLYQMFDIFFDNSNACCFVCTSREQIIIGVLL